MGEEIKTRDIIADAINEPLLLASDEYINTQLEGNWLLNLAFQMGPNCNLACSHCYGNYGPHRQGLPTKELADKLIGDLEAAVMFDVTLTDGEPMREENKLVLGSFARVSSTYPLNIITNGVFAKNERESIKWFSFLKDQGFDISSKGNMFLVSAGLMYNVPKENYAYLAHGLKEVFPGVSLEDHLSIAYYTSGHEGISPKDNLLLNDLCSSLYTAFQEKGHPKISLNEDVAPFNFVISVDFGEGFNFKIDARDYDPVGRGNNNCPSMQQRFLKKIFTLENIGFYPDSFGALVVDSTGNVSFGNSLTCFAEGRKYGNVMEESLRDIKKRIYSDPIYQAFRLGGVRFMYFLAKEIKPDFSSEGRIRCDLCTNLFGNLSLLGSIRNQLEGEGVVNIYKNYLVKAGIPGTD